VSGQANSTKFDLIPVSNRPVRPDRFVSDILPIRERSSVGIVAFAACDHQFAVQFADGNRRSDLALKFGKATAMVNVSLGVQQDLHVPRLKAEPFDVGFGLLQHLNTTRIDQDVARRRNDQERTDHVTANVVDVSHKAPGFDRLRPVSQYFVQCLLFGFCLVG
jgi:hypothetical protein